MRTRTDASAHFSAFKRSLRLLRTPRFGTYYVATLLSNIGTWSQQIAEPWLPLSLGASPFLIGPDAFVQAAPAWILILAGGILADKADRLLAGVSTTLLGVRYALLIKGVLAVAMQLIVGRWWLRSSLPPKSLGV